MMEKAVCLYMHDKNSDPWISIMVWSLIQNVEKEADIIHTHRLFLGFYFKKQYHSHMQGHESIMKQWVF